MGTILEMRGMTKCFGDLVANDNVDLTVEEGTVHSIIGENGAGKTTLMNILYGLYTANSGQIILRGSPVHIRNSSDAIDLGIGMIHQHFKLVPVMTVAENVTLGMEPRRFNIFLDHRKRIEQTQAISTQYGLRVDPKNFIADCPVGIQQRVEILKALYHKANILILDEPTALLTPQESTELFEIIRLLCKDGKTILFISHKLKEIMEISDWITVLRDGKVVGTVAKKDTNEVGLARMMVGRDVFLRPAPTPKKIGEKVLEVENVSAINIFGTQVLKDISFDVRQGEILGIAGVDGNGQTELVRALIGLQHLSEGKISHKGKNIANLPVSEIRDSGLGVIPEDRLNEGLILDFRVEENLFLGLQIHSPFSRNGVINWKLVGENAHQLIDQFSIRPSDKDQIVKLMSGGNQQKVIVARELSHSPDILIAAQPTRGLDIAATDFVHGQLINQRDLGRGILLFSLSLDEIFLLSNRIAVMHKGEIVKILERNETTPEEVGLLMLGVDDVAPLPEA
jgi:general nucleoside transport system ATP-binding protein